MFGKNGVKGEKMVDINFEVIDTIWVITSIDVINTTYVVRC